MFDIIGIQSHQHGGAWPVEKIWEVCERFARYGKPLHFTETTFVSGEPGWDLRDKRRKSDPKFEWVSTPEGEKRQAEDVVRFYTVLFSHPSVEAITWWTSPIRTPGEARPPASCAGGHDAEARVRSAQGLIKGKWWTRQDDYRRGRQGGVQGLPGALSGDGRRGRGTGSRRVRARQEADWAVEVRLK
jgi:hypothetical protein